MKKMTWMMLLAVVLLLPGCKKYEDGPYMSLYSKGMRVAGTWYFQSVRYGSKDSTSRYSYQQMQFIYVKKYDGGAFTWNRNLLATSANENPLVGGTWKFFSDRDSIEMVVFMDVLRRDSVVMKWRIRRLAYTEFWLERPLKDTVNLEWQLVKYVY